MNIFSVKKETNDILSAVEKEPLAIDTLEQFAIRLAELGEGAVPFVLEYLVKERDTMVVKKVAYLIEMLNDPAYAAMLHSLLINGTRHNLSKKIKVELLATLKSYDETSFQEHFSHLLGSSETTYLLWVKRVLEDFDSREYRTISLLEECLHGGSKKIDLLKKISSMFQEEAVPLLAILADSDNMEISQTALIELGKIRDNKSAKALKNIIAFSWQKKVLNGAEKALRRLSFAGVDVGLEFVPSLMDYSESRAFISPIDGMGNINICISVKNTENRVETLCLVLNNEMGILDIYGSKSMKEKDLQLMIEEITEETTFVESNIEYALKYINHAIYLSDSRGIIVPPEFHYRKYLLSNRLKPQRFMSQFKLNRLKEVAKNDAFFERGAELIDSDEFGRWPISSPATFDYAEKMKAIQLGSGKLSKVKENNLIDEFCEEILLPFKSIIRGRLFFMADFLDRTNEKTELANIALATAFSLSTHSNKDLTSISFLRKLAKESIEHSVKAMEEGFDLRHYSEGLEEFD